MYNCPSHADFRLGAFRCYVLMHLAAFRVFYLMGACDSSSKFGFYCAFDAVAMGIRTCTWVLICCLKSAQAPSSACTSVLQTRELNSHASTTLVPVKYSTHFDMRTFKSGTGFTTLMKLSAKRISEVDSLSATEFEWRSNLRERPRSNAQRQSHSISLTEYSMQ